MHHTRLNLFLQIRGQWRSDANDVWLNCSMGKKTISQQLAEKTFRELGADRSGKPKPGFSRTSPVNSHNLPFRIRALERTKRQSAKGKAYQYSAVYCNAVVLRLLIKKFTAGLDSMKHQRLISQLDGAARSVVANIREGYLRPTTVEYSTFLGYSHGSLEEVRGDIIDSKDDGLLKSLPGSSLESISIVLKPHSYDPPSQSPKTTYDPLRDLKRKIREIRRNQLTYEIFIELVNKTDWLFKKTVHGLEKKIVTDEKRKLGRDLNAIWKKHW
ncbi:MAG: hypothetical protein A2785_03945 [Candidatus Chisholmbacteria bacterium RIFCSPHIGHO2_01_FULL_49_18]|uniref:Four helix bundle protein n=1 Tax=Candidatus Chisholmbacteria bacterium RIFCSPHIGHO2_01_FULL_49_18 TaxID=1797590 RepID=A0A1G1VPW7_9BACT|nr:MAG: hypothetical protein A2785_03945 [Candidatus Chisholmbacteria bacterium RIFCSPHIGHO2_01_FULL_49_18]